MVAYRSFKPFEPLLVSPYPEVRLWAVWAISHVCARNPARYCAMLERENGCALIQNITSEYLFTLFIRKNLCLALSVTNYDPLVQKDFFWFVGYSAILMILDNFLKKKKNPSGTIFELRKLSYGRL